MTVADLDIKGFFDNRDQKLLLRAVKKHAPQQWVVLYIERWLKALLPGRVIAAATPAGKEAHRKVESPRRLHKGILDRFGSV